MKFHTRRSFLYAFALLMAMSMSASIADVWPSKPIKFVVPFAPDGANDLIARTAAEGAGKALNQAIVIENKPGAGATIGADYVAKSTADGYTFLISAAGISGQVDATSEASIVVLPFIKSVKVRALSTSWTHRLAKYPDIPTAVEQGFADTQIAHWAGLHAPKGTAEQIVQQMSQAIDAGMKNKDIQERLKAVGIEPIGGTKASFEQFIAQERARLQNVVKSTGMTEE